MKKTNYKLTLKIAIIMLWVGAVAGIVIWSTFKSKDLATIASTISTIGWFIGLTYKDKLRKNYKRKTLSEKVMGAFRILETTGLIVATVGVVLSWEINIYIVFATVGIEFTRILLETGEEKIEKKCEL